MAYTFLHKQINTLNNVTSIGTKQVDLQLIATNITYPQIAVWA